MDLRSQIQRVSLRCPSYSYLLLHAELLPQRSLVYTSVYYAGCVRHLLCLLGLVFLTTDSKHTLPSTRT